jgi:poly(A) polymerase
MNLAAELDKPIFRLISESAKKLNLKTYVIGGFVRDLLLKRFSKDIDVVCAGSGIQLAQEVARQSGKDVSVTVFKNFGTAMLKIGDTEIEFVGARKESYRRESRKPIVEDGTLEDDQLRRDFTINALALSLNSEDFGLLVDPFDGVHDLKKKMIKTPQDPEITFSDDPLRMMRAIRFASQLGFDVAAEAFDSIKKNKHRLEIVSKERVIDELNKIILSPTPSYGFKLLYYSGLLDLILPELVKLQGVETIDGKGHKDNFFHTLQVLDNVSKVSNDLWLRWAAILHDIAKPQTKRFDKSHGWTFHGHEDLGAKMVPQIFSKLKLPLNEKMQFVKKLVRLHLRPIALVKEDITDSAIRRLLFEAGEDIEALMILCNADITSKNHEKVKRYLANFRKVEQKMVEIEEKDKLRNFQPALDGEDIMKIFNIPPGRIVGQIKTDMREALLDGHIQNDYKVLYEYVVKQGERLGLKPAE